MRRQAWSLGIVMTLTILHVANVRASGPGPSFHPACADRDLRAITFIEDHGMANDMASSQLGEAGLIMLAARADCYAGRVEQALARYDSILRAGAGREKRE